VDYDARPLVIPHVPCRAPRFMFRVAHPARPPLPWRLPLPQIYLGSKMFLICADHERSRKVLYKVRAGAQLQANIIQDLVWECAMAMLLRGPVSSSRAPAGRPPPSSARPRRSAPLVPWHHTHYPKTHQPTQPQPHPQPHPLPLPRDAPSSPPFLS
jgi:hypothetical protein